MRQTKHLSIPLSAVNFILLFLSVVGVVISAYVLQSFFREAPTVCVGGGCDLVRMDPASRPFGIPVPAFGLVGYLFLTFVAAVRNILNTNLYAKVLFFVALAGTVFVGWFTYVQLAVIHGICIWCLGSGVNMILILYTSIFALLGKKLA